MYLKYAREYRLRFPRSLPKLKNLLWWVPSASTKRCTLENPQFELFIFRFHLLLYYSIQFSRKKNYYKLLCRCIRWTWQKHQFQHKSNILWFIWSIYSKFTLNTKIFVVFYLFIFFVALLIFTLHLLSLSFTRFVCAIEIQTYNVESYECLYWTFQMRMNNDSIRFEI